MKSKVFFTNFRASPKKNLLDKIRTLYLKAEFEKIFDESDRVAIKIHWGEKGNTTFIPVPYIRTIVDEVKKKCANVYITDTNTLYSGERKNAIENIRTAAYNGFTLESTGAPIIVADGLTGTDAVEVEVNGDYIKKAKIASAIYHSTAMVVVSHFKGHMLFSFGGAIKHLGMGCATSAGKQIMHSDVKPYIDEDICKGDSICIRHCPVKCITLKDNKKAHINQDLCIGCGECIVVCPHRAIPENWKTSSEPLQCKTAEYALAAIKNKINKVVYFNFLMNITPDCDCCDWSDNRLTPDIGILASKDPVAIDEASIHLFNKAPISPLSIMEKFVDVQDKLKTLRPKIDYSIILRHAEKIGLGSRRFELIEIN
ncbi:MAG: DUF362 domain-containing protein [Deltaproteobacteria bacterium]|nr:DUF362 domain-containing protein [Deltaproteobacteria bacterium]